MGTTQQLFKAGAAACLEKKTKIHIK